ncbi:MAG: hypothetical protein QM820_55845 [Minicystis sp.]
MTTAILVVSFTSTEMESSTSDEMRALMEQEIVFLHVGGASPERVLAAVEGWLSAMPAVLAKHPATQLGRDMAEPDEIACADLLRSSDAQDAKGFTAYLTGATSPFAWMHKPPILVPYEPFTPAQESWRFSLYEHVNEQAVQDWFEHRFERLGRWPRPVQRAYFLNMARCILAGKGFEVFLQDAPLQEVKGLFDAFEAAGCERLLLRMREGLARTLIQGSAELLHAEDGADRKIEFLLERHDEPEVSRDDPPSWHEIDFGEEGVFALIQQELEGAMDAFAKERREVLGG